MRAVVVDATGSIAVDTRPDPVLPGTDGAVVAIEATAICGSDLHFLEGHYPIVDPVALGHEAVGTVVETGSDVAGFSTGDRVLVSSVAGCGRCPGCATHDPIRCVQGPQIFGSGALGGAQAELLAVPAADFQLLHLPEGISTEQALLLTDNLATGWAAAKRADGIGVRGKELLAELETLRDMLRGRITRRHPGRRHRRGHRARRGRHVRCA